MKKKLSAIIIAQMLIIVSLFAAITVADEIQWPTSWILYDEDDDENGLADYMDVKNSSYYIDDDYLFFRLECYGDIDFSQKVRFKWFIDISEPHDMMPKSNSSGNTIEGAEYLLFAEDSENPDKDGNVDIYLIESDNGLFPNGYDYITDPGNITIDLYIRRENISDPQHVYFTWATDKQTPNIDSTTGEYSDKFFDQNISKADISIIKSDSDDPVYYGGSFNYSLLVKNLGPHIANNINVTDEIPADLTFNSATPPSDNSK
jgi:uncharacterized repeat protein (TIGR01451 family)